MGVCRCVCGCVAEGAGVGEGAGVLVGGMVLGTAEFGNLFSHNLADHLANTAAKKITEDISSFAGRNLPKRLENITAVHGGLPVGCNRRSNLKIAMGDFRLFKDYACTHIHGYHERLKDS